MFSFSFINNFSNITILPRKNFSTLYLNFQCDLIAFTFIIDFILFLLIYFVAGFTEKLAAKRFGSGLSFDLGVLFFESFGLISGGLMVDFALCVGVVLSRSLRLDCASTFYKMNEKRRTNVSKNAREEDKMQP